MFLTDYPRSFFSRRTEEGTFLTDVRPDLAEIFMVIWVRVTFFPPKPN